VGRLIRALTGAKIVDRGRLQCSSTLVNDESNALHVWFGVYLKIDPFGIPMESCAVFRLDVESIQQTDR
jgi:hypothetical protein